MIPRGRLDIGGGDLWFAMRRPLGRANRPAVERDLEERWAPHRANLACLSVRSGLDALLKALQLPAGSTILVSAVTIRDMVRVIEAHGLVAVPVDVDRRTLEPIPAALERAVSSDAKAILVAHLFGARIRMEPVLRFARDRGLLVLEDCAQAFCGDGDAGHPESDVSLFSFGPIKTATALGGAILSIRDVELAARVRAVQSGWPVQSGRSFLRRVTRSLMVKIVERRAPFTLLTTACRMLGADYDRLLSGLTRGFPDAVFFHSIRQQPAAPLLELLRRRLGQDHRANISARVAAASLAAARMPGIARPGDGVELHSHWVFPICHDEPDALMRHLRKQGFDATRAASTLSAVDPPEGRPETDPVEARSWLSRLLYLPVYRGVSSREIERMTDAVNAFATAESARLQPDFQYREQTGSR